MNTEFNPAEEKPVVKALAYGPAGSGKTHMAASFSGKTFYILTEPQGKTTLANVHLEGKWNPANVVKIITSWDDWLKFVQSITLADLKGFDLVVLDTIDHLDDYSCQHLAASKKMETVEQISDYGASRSAAIRRLHTWVVEWLQRLPVPVLVLAHQTIRESEENGIARVEISVRIFGKATELLCQKFNLVGHLTKQEANGQVTRRIKFRGNSSTLLKDHPALANIEDADMNVIIDKINKFYAGEKPASTSKQAGTLPRKAK